MLLVLTGATSLSLNGLLLRNLDEADGWQILFYRGVALFTALFLILCAKYRRDTARAFLDIGLPGLWASLALGLGSCFYVFALLFTTVANAMFIIGSAPILTAAVAWVVLRERLPMVGIIAMTVALCGIGLMFADGIIAGRWFGNVMAVFVVVGFVSYLLIIRRQRNTDMLPVVCLTGLIMAAAGFIGAPHLNIPLHDVFIAILMGSILYNVGFVSYTVAARYILAAEVSLFAVFESILAPIWVWIGVSETPSVLTLTGSSLVFVAITTYCLVAISREKKSHSFATIAANAET